MPGLTLRDAGASVPAPAPPAESQSCSNWCQWGNWSYWAARSQGGRYRWHSPSCHSGAFPRAFSSHLTHARTHACMLVSLSIEELFLIHTSTKVNHEVGNTLHLHSPHGKPTAGDGQRPYTRAMPLCRSSSHSDKEGFQHEIMECETTPQTAM